LHDRHRRRLFDDDVPAGFMTVVNVAVTIENVSTDSDGDCSEWQNRGDSPDAWRSDDRNIRRWFDDDVTFGVRAEVNATALVVADTVDFHHACARGQFVKDVTRSMNFRAAMFVVAFVVTVRGGLSGSCKRKRNNG